MLSVMFGLVLGITPNEQKQKRISLLAYTECNPKTLEVAFLTEPATEFFAVEQLQVLQERYLGRALRIELRCPDTQMSKAATGSTADCRPQGGQLPLHCLSTLPDLWPPAEITMEKPSQWVSKLCRLYFADEYARRTAGTPSASPAPVIEAAPGDAENLPKA